MISNRQNLKKITNDLINLNSTIKSIIMCGMKLYIPKLQQYSCWSVEMYK